MATAFAPALVPALTVMPFFIVGIVAIPDPGAFLSIRMDAGAWYIDYFLSFHSSQVILPQMASRSIRIRRTFITQSAQQGLT